MSPRYDYQCDECLKCYEIIHNFDDVRSLDCEECGGMLFKVFTPPAVHFKGSGFYSNDKSAK